MKIDEVARNQKGVAGEKDGGDLQVHRADFLTPGLRAMKGFHSLLIKTQDGEVGAVFRGIWKLLVGAKRRQPA